MARKQAMMSGFLLPLLISAISIHGTSAQTIQCTQLGKFSLPDSCQEYYVCSLYRGRFYASHAVCPAGSMFDDILRECTPNDLLTSPLNCVQEATPTDITAVEGGSSHDGLAVCDLINEVNDYSTLVATSAPMRETSAHQVQYNRHIAHYNRDLENAQKNTSPWKNGESILSGLKNTYLKANAYVTEFQRKLDINKKEIQAISARELNQKHVDRLKKDIESLQNEIKGAQEALQATDGAVRKYFEGVISSKTQEIESKQQQISSYSKEGLILNELINFLGFVRDEADEVGSMALQWKLQVNSLLENVGSDGDNFDRFAIRIGEDIKLLTKEQESLQDGLVGVTVQEQQLEEEKSSLNNRMNALNGRNSEISREVSELIGVMGNKTESFNSLVASACGIGGQIASAINEGSLNIESYRACESRLQRESARFDTTHEEARIKNLRSEAAENRKQVKNILNRLWSITEELKGMSGTVSPQKTRLDQIRVEITSLQSHANDLENLKNGVSSALQVLVKLEEELQDLQDTFDPISNEIQNLIGQAHAALTQDDKHLKRTAIEEAVDNMQTSLGYFDLPDITEC